MKPCAYKQSELLSKSDGVPIEECAGDLISVARLSCYDGAVAKASLNRAISCWY